MFSIENRALTLSIAQRPPWEESSEENCEPKHLSRTVMVEVPLEELAVRCSEGALACL